MSGKGPNSGKSAVEAHYSAHPYPKADAIDTMALRREELNTLAGRWSQPIPRDARILVAGCGTREALSWALCFPQAQVYGCDLSSTSLAIGRSLIEQLGVTNVRLEQRDLLTLDDEDGLFDVVSSWGVLHHLPDPLQGLRTIRARLRPGGVMHLMLYSRRNRYYIRDFQELVRKLAAPGGGDAGAKMATAKGLTLGTGWKDSRLARFSEYVRGQHDNDPPHWADSFVHPQETDYDLPGLFELLEAGGARFLAWNKPWTWVVRPRFKDPKLAAAYSALDQLEQWEVADRMMMPVFDLLAGLASDPPAERPWMGDDDALLDSVLARTDGEQIILQGNIDRGQRKPLKTLIVDRVKGRKDAVELHTLARFTLVRPRVVATLIKHVDGERTLRAACEAACASHRVPFDGPTRQELVSTARQLIHPYGALLVRAPGP